MKKEGFGGDILSSNNGKINLGLLFSVILIMVSMLWSVEAITITLFSPGNLTYNNTKALNFSFNVTWTLPDEAATNCTLWINSTVSGSATWVQVKVNDTNNSGADDIILNQSISYMNYTLNSSDGNFSWNVGCYDKPLAGALTFAAKGATSNNTVLVDTLAPALVLDTPKGTLMDATEHNITSYGTATFYVNVSDNSTRNVWAVINSQGTIDSAGNSNTAGVNQSVNRTFIEFAEISAPDRKSFLFNLSPILDFNSTFTSPGVHSVFFCANDSQGRITCTNRSDFIIKGMNITQMENIFSTMQQGTGFAFGGLNITLGNGTEIPLGTFMNPIDGVTIGGLTHKNFTFIFNFSNLVKVHIVGGSVDEGQFANASNSRMNSTPTTEVRQALGTGFRDNLAWADIRSFIPSDVSYLYGIIQIGGTSYSKKMYCNGTSMSAPNCGPISQCNGTVFGIYNHSIVIPPGSGCWLESGVINAETLTDGFTYIFVDHFSGGLGGEDRGPPNATFVSPADTSLHTNRSTTVSQFINFTVDDTSSTGLNLTANNSINVTVSLGYRNSTGAFISTVSPFALFSYFNSTSTNLSCDSVTDRISLQNTTKIVCNTTVNLLGNGTYLINISGRDTSNNSNAMNLTTSFIFVTVDQIPPIVSYVNFTNASAFNASGIGSGDNNNSIQLGTTAGTSRAQGDANTGMIYAVANWTDNLTQPYQGLLQVYNATWQTLNATNVTPFANSGWSNFSFFIDSGHNLYEGANVSFRIIANDTVGNVNSSPEVRNFTILINDTTKPTLRVTVVDYETLNGTNTTDTTPRVVWNVTEGSALRYVAVQFNSLTDTNCNQFRNFTTSVASNRNGTLTLLDSGGCPGLSNGTNTIRLTAEDTYGNSELYIHSFTVQSGNIPVISLKNLTTHDVTAIYGAANLTNVTTKIGFNFSAVVQTGQLKNLTYTSSCNSTLQEFAPGQVATQQNLSFIWPFNYTSCIGAAANRTLTLTATDFSGNSIANVFQLFVDEVAPSLAVNNPTEGFNGPNEILINLTAKDNALRISAFSYYLDGSNIPVLLNNTLNFDLSDGANLSLVNTSNFTVGRHTIKFSVNDSLGNMANSSSISFTVTGPINFPEKDINTSLVTYLTNVSLANITNASGFPLEDTRNVTNQVLNLKIELNTTPGRINVSLTFNASAANWDKYNFSVLQNNSLVIDGIVSNQSARVLDIVIFNDSINEFIQDTAYFGRVTFPMNASTTDIGLTVKLQWYENSSKLKSPTNITSCLAAYGSSFAPSIAGITTPCWNNTNNVSIDIFVPHFSHIVKLNNSIPPTVTINKPASTEGLSSFIPNITVSDDTLNCTYSYNSSSGDQSSQILMTLVEDAVISQCVASSAITNLTNGTTINITFYVYDTANNLNQTSQLTVINDLTPHTSAISDSGGSTTGTTVSLAANESVNMSLIYGAAVSSACTTMGSTATPETDYSTSQSIAITLSTVTSATVICYNVTSCDKAGNCITNSSFNFTQTATTSSTTSTSSSSGGGGSAGGAVSSNVDSSAARQWESLAAGTSAVLSINNAKIAVVGVIIDVKNALTNPSLTVDSLLSNPRSTAAAAKVYQYLQITRANMLDLDASKITIRFKVPKSWLAANGVSEDNIVLYRFSDDKWNALPTSKTGADVDNILYESTTPGFSTFAIGSGEAAPVAPPAAPVEQPTTPTAPTGEVTTAAATAEQPAAPAEAKPGLSKTAMAWIAVLVIVVVAAIGYFVWQKKKED
ncbi:PGF-pre-PGF domain-containing protein [Candidatus Woesearchaeota archaeon]|nr:PGF-pre-PGF domain-containing protein [Candidatus Woesearchaeota archaeon]